jgi:hypothetical protein
MAALGQGFDQGALGRGVSVSPRRRNRQPEDHHIKFHAAASLLPGARLRSSLTCLARWA